MDALIALLFCRMAAFRKITETHVAIRMQTPMNTWQDD